MGQSALTAVTRTQGATRALKDGSVRPAGWTLNFEEVPVLIQAFRRMVRTLDFDVTAQEIFAAGTHDLTA
jgi:4,5-dihydroxyphthalate decarboxylase